MYHHKLMWFLGPLNRSMRNKLKSTKPIIYKIWRIQLVKMRLF
ncbi:MAG: hypothetical protein ACI9MS_001404 [Glaciecola sp.]|jgi:hypothetical protein